MLLPNVTLCLAYMLVPQRLLDNGPNLLSSPSVSRTRDSVRVFWETHKWVFFSLCKPTNTVLFHHVPRQQNFTLENFDIFEASIIVTVTDSSGRVSQNLTLCTFIHKMVPGWACYFSEKLNLFKLNLCKEQ